MRSIALVTFAALLATSSVSCGPVRREVELSWTFAGKTCAQVGVASIRVAVNNEVLTPDTFPCSSGGNQVNTGAELGAFLLGRYDFTVQGLDASGQVAYQDTQTFRVADVGLNQFTIDALVGSGGSSAVLAWTFDTKFGGASDFGMR